MMVEGEATQEPNAPEGAPASPPSDSAAAPAPEAAVSPPTEAEAAPAGEAAVEAAAGGEAPADWSHLRGFQTVEAPAEALTARADYAEELGKELAVRAARYARSVDESIVLSSDGLMRWLGDPVARVVAGDELLQPRAVLLADEALAGDDRAAVETRTALWLAAHVRKVLGPLLALSEGVELSEAARALGGKIAEALGVLDRDRVRNDVRALDQTARGALRKLGVRFGSLYIYAPALLKPGARSLCSLLWTLRRGTEPGADRLLAFAAAGRTSFANEGLLSPDAYRVAGFRLCGERVVRVDIIERLSDLIRAAIPDHMRSGSRPTSEAYGFLITPQMTSLTGCSGEPFASILRSLGFEPVKVSKAKFEAANARAPMEPIKPPAPSAEAAPEAVEAEAIPEGDAPETAEGETTEVAAEAAAEQVAAAAAAETEAAPETAPEVEAEAAPEVEEAPQAEVEAAPQAQAQAEVDAAPQAQAQAEAEAPAQPEVEAAPEGEPAEPASALTGEAEAASPAAAVDADEEIEIWRPTPRRPRAPRPNHEAREARPHRGKPHRRENRPGQDAPRQDPAHQDAPGPDAAAPQAAAPDARAQSPHRPPRPERRDEGPRRFEGKGEREDRRPHKDFGPRREPRPTQVDPDSPFAKLAALKPLLERRDKRP
jgi:ATP-dependent RNA helicase SUPV3L1/SUV3